ncbi:LytR/AlgR family response regulator transcription factor [Mangrovibacterium diazotrophicum]|uniref:LytTR family two component transcriptional regulator n=1 Tax=Mangrovibacterium diazotrophicum TaxID=1261403 RepID=A0A419WAE9_9BACT|nr:LytTR family DNA-binding domain-containing protein [Mangrovibacterium diazotrophicum]RKD92419.1 LytTR family two component transcriptional regulator [Mangrovibacterium diazotrophicum]
MEQAERKYNCLVVDDEFLARKLIAEYISKVSHLNLVASLDSPVDAIDLIAKGNIDILFIDIEMSEISGIDFIKYLTGPNRPLVIFVTAYPQYAVQGFEVDAIEYLIKPATFPRFIKAVNKATDILNMKSRISKLEQFQAAPAADEKPADAGNDHIIVRTDRKIVKLRYNDILFIEGAMEYVNFQTKEQRIMGLFSLRKLEEELPADQFMRIHKSFIVAIDKITEIDGNQVKVGQWTIYVSKNNRPKLVQLFSGNTEGI